MTDDWYFTQRLIQIFLLQAHLSSVIHSPRHFCIMLSAFIYLVFFMLLKILSNALHHHHHQFSDNNDHYHFFLSVNTKAGLNLAAQMGRRKICVFRGITGMQHMGINMRQVSLPVNFQLYTWGKNYVYAICQTIRGQRIKEIFFVVFCNGAHV